MIQFSPNTFKSKTLWAWIWTHNFLFATNESSFFTTRPNNHFYGLKDLNKIECYQAET